MEYLLDANSVSGLCGAGSPLQHPSPEASWGLGEFVLYPHLSPHLASHPLTIVVSSDPGRASVGQARARPFPGQSGCEIFTGTQETDPHQEASPT